MKELLEIFIEAAKVYDITIKGKVKQLKETADIMEVILKIHDSSKTDLILIINELLNQLQEVEVENKHYAEKLKESEEETEII